MPVTTGDIRKELGKDLMKSIEKVINDYTGKYDEYYILIRSDWEGREIIRTKLMIMKEMPPALINTLCVYVNNKEGRAEMLRALPADIPIEHVEMSDEGSEGVFDSAKNTNSPIVY